MTSLPILSGQKMIKILYHFGFTVAHRSKGGHVVLKHGSNVCVVPLHSELAMGTLSSILRQAGISRDDFIMAYQRRK